MRKDYWEGLAESGRGLRALQNLADLRNASVGAQAAWSSCRPLPLSPSAGTYWQF